MPTTAALGTLWARAAASRVATAPATMTKAPLTQGFESERAREDSNL